MLFASSLGVHPEDLRIINSEQAVFQAEKIQISRAQAAFVGTADVYLGF